MARQKGVLALGFRILLRQRGSCGTIIPPGVRQKGLDNMKQISTGAGLVALSVGMVATAFVATHRGSGEAFAQGTGGERRIVAAGVVVGGPSGWGDSIAPVIAYRIWSDNAVDLRLVAGAFTSSNYQPLLRVNSAQSWQTVDNGTSGFRPLTDVDMSGETDAGDISQVLLDFNTRADDVPPPPIDCSINAPR
jgi:hypothetical protein